MSRPSDPYPLHPELVEPALIPFLLAQSRTTQDDLANELGTTQQRLSRVANSRARLSALEFVIAARRLALGEPGEDDGHDGVGEPMPVWVLTRWHASTLIEPPPITRASELPVFVNFREAELAADYLRCFRNTGSPVALPVWRSWLRKTLEARGLGLDAVRTLAPPGSGDMAIQQGYVDELSDVHRALHGAFATAHG